MTLRFLKLILLGLLIAPAIVQAAVSAQVAYKISVTIPAIVGFNLKDPISEELALDQTGKNPANDILIEETVRDNQPIILRTITPK